MMKTNKKTKQVTKPAQPDRIPRFKGDGFPASIRVNLLYEDLIHLVPSAIYGSYVFRGNSLFDPDYTSTGHQPRYYDQMTAVYGKYKVISSKIRVEMINNSTSTGAIYAVTPNTEIVTFTNWQQAAELPRSKISEILPIANRYPFKVTNSIRTQTVCGLLPYQINDEDWSAASGANPVQIWYWNINVISVDNSTNVDVMFRVRLEYEAHFYDRLDVGTS